MSSKNYIHFFEKIKTKKRLNIYKIIFYPFCIFFAKNRKIFTT